MSISFAYERKKTSVTKSRILMSTAMVAGARLIGALMRVRNGASKSAFVVAGYALALVIGLVIESSTGSGWGVVVSSWIVLLLVLVLTRLFRGENESDAPRAWWRMTASPTAGYVLSGLFAFSVIGSIASSAVVLGSWVSGIVSLVIAIAYLNSSIRLSRTGVDQR